MEIIIDDRERAVSVFCEEISDEEHIEYKVKRMEVGDYAICYKGYIMILIERKTWADLAASLRDGRKANIQKLLAAREETNCQLVYLIEGRTDYHESHFVSNMPIKNLQAHLDHIAFRDGIHMIWSSSPQNSARRIFSLARNYSTIKPSPFKEIDEYISTQSADTNTDVDGGHPVDPADLAANSIGNSALLTDKSINDAKKISIEEQLLQTLPSVGSIISTLLAENNITLSQILLGQVLEEQIARIKYQTGKAIGLDKARKIIANQKILQSSSQIAKKTKIKILATIPRVTKKTAEKILELVDLKDLLVTTDHTVLENIQLSDKRKLGTKLAKEILNHISTKMPNN